MLPWRPCAAGPQLVGAQCLSGPSACAPLAVCGNDCLHSPWARSAASVGICLRFPEEHLCVYEVKNTLNLSIFLYLD